MIERTNNGERWDDALSFHEVEKKKEKKKKKGNSWVEWIRREIELNGAGGGRER